MTPHIDTHGTIQHSGRNVHLLPRKPIWMNGNLLVIICASVAFSGGGCNPTKDAPMLWTNANAKWRCELMYDDATQVLMVNVQNIAAAPLTVSRLIPGASLDLAYRTPGSPHWDSYFPPGTYLSRGEVTLDPGEWLQDELPIQLPAGQFEIQVRIGIWTGKEHTDFISPALLIRTY